MRRLIRIIVSTITLLSLTLFGATIVLWMRSSADRDSWKVGTYPNWRISATSRETGIGLGFARPIGVPVVDDFDAIGRAGYSPPKPRFVGRRNVYLEYGIELVTMPGASQVYPARYWNVFASHWCVACVTAVVPLLWLLDLRKRRQRRRPGHCRRCGYDLRATPNQCPECGAMPAARPN